MQVESKEEESQQVKSQPKTKKLWGKLKNLLLNKDEFTLQQQLYLNILPQISLENNIVEYNLGKDNLNVLIKKQKQSISLEEMKKNNEAKVDSTGISLWPAEELLAYYCMKNIHMFLNMKKIAEYGAGYSGLAGIALAKLLMLNSSNTTQFQIEISDGNEECANLLQENIQLNISDSQHNNLQSNIKKHFSNKSQIKKNYLKKKQINMDKYYINKTIQHLNYIIEISKNKLLIINYTNDKILFNYCLLFYINLDCLSSKQYIWEENGQVLDDEQRFDCIIIADCLFFRNYHNALISTIQRNLSKTNGQCIIIAPSRGGTLQEFLQKCEGKLKVEIFDFEDETYKNIINKIKESPQYNQDMHQYFFIKIINNII